MAEAEISNVLVAGIDVVSLATSARRAGYQVYATDYFGDLDLKRVCRVSASIVKQKPGKTCGQMSKNFDPGALLHLTRKLLKKNKIDATLLSFGLDDSPDVLHELNDLVPILGNHPNVIEKVRDKTEFFHELRRLGIPHPKTAIVVDFKEAKTKAKDIGYPVLVKPSKGFGGAGIRKAEHPRELEKGFKAASLFDERVLIQQYVSGIPASVSMISTTARTITLTLNEQLLGMREVAQEEPFGYCGNVVPLMAAEEFKNRFKSMVKRVASHFNLLGSNGIDLVISNEGIPYVIEVNPRFQGTLECVERTLNVNVVKAHVDACVEGKSPTFSERSSAFCVRMILSALHRSIVPDLSVYSEVRDLPLPGVVVEKGEPVCSVVVEAVDRNSSLKKARIIAESICKSLQPQRRY